MWLSSVVQAIQGVRQEDISRAADILAGAGRIFLIGNGGSAAIASHIATDYTKNWKRPAVAFTDAALLTCYSNDFGYPAVFEQALNLYPITMKDVLVAISSSGKSQNILRGVTAALDAGAKVITLSGFSEHNPLRKRGSVNFYVPSDSYGVVEITHLAILHSMVRI